MSLRPTTSLRNVIFFSGNRRGMPDDEGMANCAEGIKQVVGLAEKKKVTLIMELLNSKVDHQDYMCDQTPWGVKLVKQVGSPRFKLLYDIYHMQIMEGDVIRTIRENKDYIGHYHTGGNPGRHEIDETQELNYPAIVKAILDTGYDGLPWAGVYSAASRASVGYVRCARGMPVGFVMCNVAGTLGVACYIFISIAAATLRQSAIMSSNCLKVIDW